MEIEIKNEAQALNICSNAKSQKIKELNSHINTLNTLINKIKVNWSSTGEDQATYIAELEKQSRNLQEISNQSYRFFDVIERYVTNTQETRTKTIDSVRASGTSSSRAISGAVSGVAAKNVANGLSNGFVGGFASNLDNGVNGLSNGAAMLANGVSIGKTGGSAGNSAVTLGTTGTSGTSGIVGAVGAGEAGVDSSYSGGVSAYVDGGSSRGDSSTITSVHGKASGTTTTVSGGAGETSGAGSTNGAVTTAASEIFTSSKLDGVIPKLSVPMSSGGTSGSKAVPIVSGGIAAGAVGLGAAAILKKTSIAKLENNLEIDAWDETKEVATEPEASTMEQKLGKLTFEDNVL